MATRSLSAPEDALSSPIVKAFSYLLRSEEPVPRRRAPGSGGGETKERAIIARVWHGATPEAKGDEYLDYLRETGLKDCEGTPGNRGVYILRRVDGGRADFLFVSLWESFATIRAFSGPEVDKAVYYPRCRDFLLEMEPHVRHYVVVDAPRT